MQIPKCVVEYLSVLSTDLPEHRINRISRYLDRLFEQTVLPLSDGTMFVLTGDIPAMWIRDSTWQMLPLLQMNPDEELCKILGGVSQRQARFLQIDPYANAFNETPSGNCWHKDFADQSPWVFERKFELDSWSTFFELALSLYETTGYSNHLNANFWNTAQTILDLCYTEQRHDSKSYRLSRANAPEADFLSHDGYGAPVAFTGMVWSGFRPSDDRCVYGYHIPSNAHLASTLKRLSPIALQFGLPEIAKDSVNLSEQIRAAVLASGNQHGRYPYELDGFGNAIYMDDPNIPNLLSLPKLGFCDLRDPIYQATRNWLLSEEHEFFVADKGFTGFSSEHTPEGWIWPLSMAMIGLTSVREDEVQAVLTQLEQSDGLTGDMHESFMPSEPSKFTRPWFSWADMTYINLALASIN